MTRVQALFRALTPLGRAWVIVAVVGVLAILGWRTGLRWDPFGIGERRLEQAQARADAAEAELRARSLEALGEREQQVRLEIHHQTVGAVEAATAVVVQQSGVATDASVPLDPARTARLRAHDRELCRISPDLDGCAAASDPG